MAYEILEELGRGKTATVYRGIDLTNKREVAMKRRLKTKGTQKEIDNHKLVSTFLDCVPKFYDAYEGTTDGERYVYIVQELIIGDGLLTTWLETKNWDFIWLTIYHALKTIRELHINGLVHKDLHPNNYLWTGVKLYVIDFETLTSTTEKIKQLERERDAIARSLPENWQELEEYEDYEVDPIEHHNDEILKLKRGFCSDFRSLFGERFNSILEITNSQSPFANFNHGKEKFEIFKEYTLSSLCERYDRENYVSHVDYYNNLIQEYNRLDDMIF